MSPSFHSREEGVSCLLLFGIQDTVDYSFFDKFFLWLLYLDFHQCHKHFITFRNITNVTKEMLQCHFVR